MIALLASGLALASPSLEDALQQAIERTDGPVAVCPVGASAQTATRRLLESVPADAVILHPLPRGGDPDQAMQQALSATRATCALRIEVDGGLLVTPFGECAAPTTADGTEAPDRPPAYLLTLGAARASWFGVPVYGPAVNAGIGGHMASAAWLVHFKLTRGRTPEGLLMSYGGLGLGLETTGHVVRVGAGVELTTSRMVRATDGGVVGGVGPGVYGALRFVAVDSDTADVLVSLQASGNLGAGTPAVVGLTVGMGN